MRRLLSRIVTASIAAAVPGGQAVAGIPPPPLPAVQFHIEVFGDCYITVTSETTATIGRAVEWTNDESEIHWFQEDSAELWEIQLDGGETLEGVASAAGVFSQSCDDGPSYSWTVHLKARAHPASPDFKVTWATPEADASWHYDVQYRVGSRSWRTWYSDTTMRTATFDGVSDRRYSFRSRVINSGTSNASGWSPRRVVVT